MSLSRVVLMFLAWYRALRVKLSFMTSLENYLAVVSDQDEL
jgi:hypothetical protein